MGVHGTVTEEDLSGLKDDNQSVYITIELFRIQPLQDYTKDCSVYLYVLYQLLFRSSLDRLKGLEGELAGLKKDNTSTDKMNQLEKELSSLRSEKTLYIYIYICCPLWKPL